MQESLLLFTRSHNYYLGLSSFLDKKSKDIEDIGYMSVRHKDISIFKVFGVSKPFLKSYFNEFEYFFFDFKEKSFIALNSSVGIIGGVWMSDEFSFNDPEFSRNFYNMIFGPDEKNKNLFYKFCLLCFDIFNYAFILPSKGYFSQLSEILNKFFNNSRINIFFIIDEIPLIVCSNVYESEQMTKINNSKEIITAISDIYLHSGQRAGHLNDLRKTTLKPFYKSRICNIDTTIFLSIYHKNSFYGAVLIDFQESYCYYENELLEGLSSFLSYITITNDRMNTIEEMIIKDKLTGLPNYRYFKTIFSQELERSFRFNYPIGIGLLKINGMSDFDNDHGEDKGDEMIKALVTLLNSTLRKLDKLFRFSHDRFAMLLPNINEEFSDIPINRINNIIKETYANIGINVGFLILYPTGKELNEGEVETIVSNLLLEAIKEDKIMKLSTNK